MPGITMGTCYVQFAYDVAFSIDLAAAETRIREATQRSSFKHRRRAAKYFRYEPAPIRFTQSADPLTMAGHTTDPVAEILVYDFGGISVVYRIPLSGSLSRLLELSYELYENPVLQTDAHRRIEQLLAVLEPAM